MKRLIIDLSENNGVINYRKVADAGVTNAILKVCPGVGKLDSKLLVNAHGLSNVNIDLSYYHVIHPDTREGTIEQDAAAEANHFIRSITGLPKPKRLWVDIEDWDSKGTDSPLNKVDFQTWLSTYMATLDAACLDAGIYTYADYFNRHLPSNHVFGGRKLWIANYGNVDTPPLPVGFDSYYMWQYTDKGKIDGISTAVDISVLNGDIK